MTRKKAEKSISTLAQLCNPIGEWEHLKDPSYTPRVTAASVCHKQPYTCPELGQTSNRPGAYDAYSKPSIMQGQPVPYRKAY